MEVCEKMVNVFLESDEMRRSPSKIPRPRAEFKTTEVESVLLLEKHLVAGCVTVLTSPLAIHV